MSDKGKQTLKRIASALIGLPVYFAAIVTDQFYGIPIFIISTFISLAALYEFYKITDRSPEGGVAAVWFGMAFGFIINLIMYFFAFGKIYGYTKYVEVFDAKAIMFLFVIILFFLQVYQLTQRPVKGSAYSISVTVAGLLIIVFPFSHIILLKSLNDGVFYILMLNILIMSNDTFAYFGGMFFGKHKTDYIVSPNKTWEGYFSGLLFTIISVLVTNQFYTSFFGRKLFTLDEAVVLGIFFSIAANIGDLSESLFKRDGGKKDSGTMIPGHGGMWDTFDALIFSMPIFYYYLILKGVI